MLLSTTMPITSTRAAREMLSRKPPASRRAAQVPRTATGMLTETQAAVRRSRKRARISTTSASPMAPLDSTMAKRARTEGAVSLA